jgi:protein kinase A
MAAAAVKSLLPHHILSSNDSSSSASSSSKSNNTQPLPAPARHDPALAQKEIQSVADSAALGSSSTQLRVQDFELLKTLGTGTFARVWLARLAGAKTAAEREKVFALKILRKVDVIRLKQVEHVRNERATLRAVAGHPFITTLITTFRDHDCLYMLLDYCPGGEVFTYLRRARRFSERIARFYAAEILLVLEFLHEGEGMGIAYRDLKPENILVDAQGHLKLVDFGFAKRLDEGSSSGGGGGGGGGGGDADTGSAGAETYTLCGTPEYLAPEVIRNQGHGTAVDWWAFGILTYEFLVGQPPFWDQNPMKIYSKIVDGHITFPGMVSREAKDLVCALCQVSPAKRLGNIAGGAARVKQHAWWSKRVGGGGRGEAGEGPIVWDDLYYKRVAGPIVPRWKGGADASCFDDYDDAAEGDEGGEYTPELEGRYDAEFADF